MLIVYLEQFHKSQQDLLLSWRSYVHYWPRSYVNTEVFNSAIPVDYWLLFNNVLYADIWLMKYPDNSRVIRTLFDTDISASQIQHP